jgi:endonuclease IV
VGSTIEEIALFAESDGVSGIALDFVHAICTANHLKCDAFTLIESFLAFKPKIFHLSDADKTATIDKHLNLGKGNLAIEQLLAYVPSMGNVTLETPNDYNKDLNDFKKDVYYLRTFVNSKL